HKRYHWVVLPQGMQNSPTMCQIYVAWALEPLRKQFLHLLIYHYMDDILIAGKQLEARSLLSQVEKILTHRGLKIAPEKVQNTSPWKYLGWLIDAATVRPVKLTITKNISTVHDVQKLVGDIQWVHTICGITNDDLQPLVNLLGTSSHADDTLKLGPSQQQSLEILARKI
ncbi:hypothetical protein N326_13270, partial [Eurypyga helias]